MYVYMYVVFVYVSSFIFPFLYLSAFVFAYVSPSSSILPSSTCISFLSPTSLLSPTLLICSCAYLLVFCCCGSLLESKQGTYCTCRRMSSFHPFILTLSLCICFFFSVYGTVPQQRLPLLANVNNII